MRDTFFNGMLPPIMTKKHKDITRVGQESKRSHGWYVRLRFQGKTQSKLFSDKRNGGKHTALEAAISWRNETEKRLGKTRTDKHIVTFANSGTGVVGVRLNEKYNRYEICWVTPEGRQGKTSVSIRKYGKEAAFIKACTIRHQKEKERLGTWQP